jgi:LPXTG-motif cell wall-anchored protein
MAGAGSGGIRWSASPPWFGGGAAAVSGNWGSKGMSNMLDLKKLTSWALAAACLSGGAAQAALHDRGGGMVYDDVLNITWLADANYAITSGWAETWQVPTFDGRMYWDMAMLWASTLEFGGYTDWRLPSPLENISNGYACRFYYVTPDHPCDATELGYMLADNLGATATATDRFGRGLSKATNQANLALFKNLHPSWYWTNSRVDGGFSAAYIFGFQNGEIGEGYLDDPYATGAIDLGGYWGLNYSAYAWAVRDGDVTPVPEPQTSTLMLAGSGLAGLAGWVARRRRQVPTA